jgi:flagellar protein FliO/FliZ
MENIDFSRFFLSLAFVIFLIWLTAHLLKRSGIDRKLRGATGNASRLQVVDVLYLDPRRKLLLARADAREYLILLAGDSATLIDRLTDAPKAKKKDEA